MSSSDSNAAKFPTFPLTRYFFITGILVAFVPLLLGGLFNRDMREELSEEGEKLAKKLVEDLAVKVSRRFKQHYRRTGKNIDLSTYDERRKFESWLSKELGEFDTETVTFIRNDGSIGYSSRESQQAREWREDPFLQSFMLQLGFPYLPPRYQYPYRNHDQFTKALSGQLNSQVKPRDSWKYDRHRRSRYGRGPWDYRRKSRHSHRRHRGPRGSRHGEGKPRSRSDAPALVKEGSDDRRSSRSRWGDRRSRDDRDKRASRDSKDSKPPKPPKDKDQGNFTPWDQAKHFMLEVYVPLEVVTADQADKPQKLGVIKVEIELARLVKIVHSASKEFTIYFIIGILTLMLALYLWIRKAEKTISERTQALVGANQQLRALSADLEKQVEQRTRELVQTQNLASLGQLSAGIAHEVCNPVASIASCAEGLLKTLKKPDSLGEAETLEEFDEYLQIIRDEAFRVKDITRNLLDFSRRGQPRGFTSVDLSGVLEAMSRLLSHRLGREEKSLVIDLGPDPVHIVGDDASLRQMVLNITLNAVDAIDSGQEIRWTMSESEKEILLYCDDQGKGFSERDLDVALEPFHTGKPVGKGTGLGLSIADSVARQHGGRIELTNREDGPGARVIVALSKESTHDLEPIDEPPQD